MREPDFDFARQRERMVERQLLRRDIDAEPVLAAMHRVPRELFVEPIDWDEAYEDHPLGIACGQTISQPYIVAKMTQMLQVVPGNRVLEIGTGSGYQAAVLAALGVRVFSVERFPELAARAEAALQNAGLLDRVEILVGDGSMGWPEEAPFDRIILTCCAPEIPQLLEDQLTEGGILLSPVKKDGDQCLRLLRKEKGKLHSEDTLPVIFVPLIGKYGFPAP